MRGLNIGAGRATFPTTKDNKHTEHLLFALEPGCPQAFDPSVEWVNIDRIQAGNIDEIVNVMRFPWLKDSDHKPFDDNSFDIVWCSHIVEHIPHQIKLSDYGGMGGGIKQHLEFFNHDGDAWFSFFYEVYRIMRPGGKLHIVAPYGNSIAGFSDPTHTRLVMPGSFSYFSPNPDAPFDYALPFHFETHVDPNTKEVIPSLFKIINESNSLRHEVDALMEESERATNTEDKVKLTGAAREMMAYADKYMLRHFSQIEELYFSFDVVK